MRLRVTLCPEGYDSNLVLNLRDVPRSLRQMRLVGWKRQGHLSKIRHSDNPGENVRVSLRKHCRAEG